MPKWAYCVIHLFAFMANCLFCLWWNEEWQKRQFKTLRNDIEFRVLCDIMFQMFNCTNISDVIHVSHFLFRTFPFQWQFCFFFASFCAIAFFLPVFFRIGGVIFTMNVTFAPDTFEYSHPCNVRAHRAYFMMNEWWKSSIQVLAFKETQEFIFDILYTFTKHFILVIHYIVIFSYHFSFWCFSPLLNTFF